MHQATLATRHLAERASLEEAEASRLAIVVEELVTNLYDHGGMNAAAEFTMEFSITEREVVLVLTDPGTSFDPSFAWLDRAIPARGGGAGLRLVRAWASHADYQTSDGLNRLRVQFPRYAARN